MNINKNEILNEFTEIRSVKSDSVRTEGNVVSCEIHVNPNFAQNVHFNPKFFAPPKPLPLIPIKLAETQSQSKFSWRRKAANQQKEGLSPSKPVTSSSNFSIIRNTHNACTSINRKYVRNQAVLDNRYEEDISLNILPKSKLIGSPKVPLQSVSSQRNGTKFLSVNKRKFVRKELQNRYKTSPESTPISSAVIRESPFPNENKRKFVGRKQNELSLEVPENTAVDSQSASSLSLQTGHVSSSKHEPGLTEKQKLSTEATKSSAASLRNMLDCSKGTRFLSVNKRKFVRTGATKQAMTTSIKSPRNKANEIIKHELPDVFHNPISRTKFKIDKRNVAEKSTLHKWKILPSKDQFKIENLFPRALYSVNKYSFKRASPTSSKPMTSNISQTVSRKAKFGNMKVKNIGGIVYKVSSHNLTRASGDPGTSSNVPINNSPAVKAGRKKINGQTLTVRGERFVLSRNGATLKRISSQTSPSRVQQRVDFGGVTFKQESANVWVRTDSHRTRSLLVQAKQRSLAILASRRRVIKTPCMIYNKFGKCMRHQRGLCAYIHHVKNIALCPRFLQGMCNVEKCLLSHNVVHQKVETCRYFLEGVCGRENCPFLHVKVNEKAAICQEFLQGFCELGQQCCKRHINKCPELESTGKCKKGKKCPYPHKGVRDSKKYKKSNTVIVKNAKTVPERKKSKKDKAKVMEETTETQGTRYYDAGHPGPSCTQQQDIVPERIGLDNLPSFIPFG